MNGERLEIKTSANTGFASGGGIHTVDCRWKRLEFQRVAFQGLGFLIFDQFATINNRSEGPNPYSSAAIVPITEVG